MLSVSQRQLIGATAFALGVLLLAPWGERARRLRKLAIPAFLVWMAMTASALAEPDPRRDAVVIVDGVVLRAADSLGAPPVFAEPLPAGSELRVEETREAWARVRLADGSEGWLAAGSLEPVAG